MATFSNLCAEFRTRLDSIPIYQVNSYNLTEMASEYAVRLSPHMGNLAMLGPDFLFGRARVNMLPNHTWSSYSRAADRIGTERLEALCASAGAINIGMYRNRLVVKDAWQVCIHFQSNPVKHDHRFSSLPCARLSVAGHEAQLPR